MMMKFLKPKILIPVFVVLALVCAYFSIGFFVDKFVSPKTIENIFKEKTGLNLVLDNPKIKTTADFSVVLSANNVKISEFSTNSEIFKIDNSSLKIKIFPLIFKKIKVYSLCANSIVANISRDKNGVYNFEKYIKSNDDFPVSFKFKKSKIKLNSIDFTFLDEYFSKKISLNSDNFNIENFSENKNLKGDIALKLAILNLDNNVLVKTTINSAFDLKFPFEKYVSNPENTLNLTIFGLDVSSFKPYILEYLNVDFDKLSGIINLNLNTENNGKNPCYNLALSIKDMNAEFLLNNKESAFTLDKNAKLEAKVLGIKDGIKILSSTFSSDTINTKIEGEITKINSNKPVPNLKIDVVNSEFISFVKLLPAGLVQYKTDLVNELKNGKPFAKVNGELFIKDNIETPDITGKIKIDDLYLIEKPVGYSPAIVNCEFLGDKVAVDVLVWDKFSQKVHVNGVSKLYGKLTGEYEVTSTSAVDLKFAQERLLPVQRVIGFKLGPLPEMKVEGKGNISIKTSGTIDDAIVYGKFVANGASASLNGLNTKLNNGHVELVFDGKKIKIENTKAGIEGGIFALYGFADDYNNIDVLAKIQNLPAKNAIKIIKTSTLVKSFVGNVDFLNLTTGNVDLDLLFKGKTKSLEGLGFFEYIDPVINVKLNNVAGEIIQKNSKKPLKFTKTNGKIAFVKDYTFDLNTEFKSTDIVAFGSAKPNSKDLSDKNNHLKLNSKVSFKNLQYLDIIGVLADLNYLNNKNLKILFSNQLSKNINFISAGDFNLNGEIPLNLALFDPSKFKIDGNFTPINSTYSKNIKFNSGTYKISGQKLNISNSNISIYNTPVFVSGFVDKILSKKPKANLKLSAKNIEVSNIVSFREYLNIAPINAFLSSLSNFTGKISAYLDIKNNRPKGKITFNNVSAFQQNYKRTIALNSGEILLSGNDLIANALNFNYGETPFYFDAKISDYFSNLPKLNAYFSTNLDESSADLFINPYLSYPVKIKGEVFAKGRIKGNVNSYTVFSYLTLPKGSDISYMGANFSETDFEREVSARIDFSKNSANVNSAKYVKYVSSLNNKKNAVTMLEARGFVRYFKNKMVFDNFKIKSENPISANFFNLLFKKSVLKQGYFTCDLNLNGNIMTPSATGKVFLRDINIPLYNTQIRDMDLNIDKNTIWGKLNAISYDSDMQIDMRLKNSLVAPYVVQNIDILSKKISLTRIFEGFSQIPRVSGDIVPGQPIFFKPSDVIIKNGSMNADEVVLYDINAKNFTTKFSTDENSALVIENANADIAGGKIVTKGKIDLNKNLFDMNSSVVSCDANVVATSFFGVKNQIYGIGDANIKLSGKIPENAQELKKLKGAVKFSLDDGKMPKLGSLEYLLRAGNLLKSGVLGLTLNNIIEVLTPYKTGEFSKIEGNFKLSKGIIEGLEIYSKGKNLSLFIYGNYDFFSDYADIEVLGRLSKNVGNLLGALGNTSLNSLLSLLTNNKLKEGTRAQIIDNANKIPLIEITGDDYRLFVARILGSLNSDDNVKSFNWLN